MFYDDNKPYFETLKWDDMFTSATDFISKIVNVGGITNVDDLTELYETYNANIPYQEIDY